MVADPQRIGHDCESRVHRAARGKEAPVYDIEIVQLVRLAVAIERRRLRIVAEADRAVLVRHAGERHPLPDEEVARDQVMLAPQRIHQALELRDQALVAFLVVRLVVQHDLLILRNRDPVVGVGQIFRSEPKVERVFRDQVERHSRHDRGGAGRQDVGIELPDEGDVPHRVLPFVGCEVVVVQCERLLEHGRVWLLRDGEHDRIDVPHVMAAHDVRAIREAARVAVVGGAQQQRRRVDRPGGNDDNVRGIDLRAAVPPHVHLGHLPSGREVTKVHVGRNGGTEVYSADIVVVSAGAINSAALLLRSANDCHPRGLANGSDVVGRHYMGHVNSVVLAISKQPNPTVFQKTLALNDYYFASDEWEYPMGHISFVGKFDANILSAGAPPIVPGMTLDLIAKHSLDFWLTSEDLPDPDNRVTVTKDEKIMLNYKPNNEEGHKRLIAKLKSLMNSLGCEHHLIPRNLFVGERVPLAGVAHQNGTIRFGDDPKASALDRNCKAHELDNLYVVDGSFFP